MCNYLKNNHLTNCSTHPKCAFLYPIPKLSASNMSIRKLLETHLKKNLPISFFFCNFASSKCIYFFINFKQVKNHNILLYTKQLTKILRYQKVA